MQPLIQAGADMIANLEPVTVVITCTLKPGKVAMARSELEAVIAIVRANEPACHGIRVHDNPKDPCRLLIIEQWESEEIFTGPHMQTAHMQNFMKKVEDFIDGAAEFSFWRQIIATN
jgi:quinol monooxygenase YgiN